MLRQPTFHTGKLDGVQQLWVEVELDRDWRAAYRLVIQDGGLVIGEVTVFPREGSDGLQWRAANETGPGVAAPPGGIRARLLRRVPIPAIGQFMDSVIAVLKRNQARLPKGVGLEDWLDKVAAPKRQEARGGQPPRSRRGRKGKGEGFYARIAQTYVTAAAESKPRPLEAIRKRERLTTNQARAAVYRARELGYLGGRRAGKVSGVLTGKAKAVLASRRGTLKKSQATTRKRTSPRPSKGARTPRR